MATNYFPLIANATANTINELPAGDNLDLTGSNIANAVNITTENITVANTLSLPNPYLSSIQSPTSGPGAWAAAYTNAYSAYAVSADPTATQINTMGGLASKVSTFEFWVYNTVNHTDDAIGLITNYQGAGVDGRIAIRLYQAATANGFMPVQFQYTTSPSVGVTIQTTSTGVLLNQWTHIAIVINASTPASSTITIYVNGVGETFTGQNLSSQTVFYDNGFWLRNNNAYGLIGYLSNLRITIGVGVYTANFTPPTTTLTATQSANTNGNPSSAISGSEVVLLTYQDSTIIDNSSYDFAINTGGLIYPTYVVTPFGGTYTTLSNIVYTGSVWSTDSGLAVNNSITGVIDFINTANVSLGNVSNLHISGGASGYVLSTDGSGVLSWAAGSGGATGATGETGATGLEGATGSSGIDGATGATGEIGATGSSGIDGATGASGLDGSTGATGETGSTGSSGIDGATGATGEIGATGSSGIDGATGATGLEGATGSSGIDGATGASGIDGSTGATGETGSTGSSGIDGATGATGEFGSTGATGETGATGASGLDGATGASGLDGATGASGLDGATGASGLDGATGASGIDGATGASGLDGATGASGIDGATGATGPVAGANTEIIFNDDNTAGASANLTFDKATNLLTVLGDINSSGNGIFGNSTGQVSITPDVNGGIEIGNISRSTAGTPFIDFHSSNFGVDYDVRLIASGGSSGINGAGNLDTYTNNFNASGNFNVTSGIISGDGAGISNIAVANIVGLGNVALANFDGSSANVLYGNGVFAPGGGGGAGSSISNGNSNVNIATANGNVTISAVGNTVMTVTGTDINVVGNMSATGNLYLPTTDTGIIGGVLGQAWVGGFDGSTQYITAPAPVIGTNIFTIEAWFYTSASLPIQTIVSFSGDFRLFVSTDGSPVVQVWQGASTLISQAITNPISQWTHIAVQRDGSDLVTIFIDGVIVNQTTLTNDWNSGTLQVGYDGGGGTTFDGYISNFRYVQGIAVYPSAFTPPTTSLTSTQLANVNGNPSNAISGAETQLLTLQNSTIIDNSSYGLTITNYGTLTTALQSTPFAGATQGTLTYDGSVWQSTALTANGNITANYFIGNGSALTGLSTSSISNGNSNVNIATANGNVTIAAVGNATMTVTGTGVNVVGTINSSANITAPYFIGNVVTSVFSNGTSNFAIPVASGNILVSVSGTANVVNFTNTSMNVAGIANITGNLVVQGTNVTIGSGTGGNIAGANAITSNSYTANGNVTGNANVSTVTGVMGIRTLASTYTDNSAAASATIANSAIHAFGVPTLSAANTGVIFTNAATLYVPAGPTTGTNATITNAYSIMAGGNARFFGNIIGTVANGNSNVYIATANGNVTVAAVGNTTLTISGTGVNVAGTANISTSVATPIVLNGNSNVSIVANANINFGVTGVANVASITAAGIITTAANAAITSNSHTVSGAASGLVNVAAALGNLGFRSVAATYTDAAATGTVANAAIHYLGTPTIAGGTNAKTYTNMATFYIAAPPTASTNATITNNFAMFVATGNTFFGGNVRVNSAGGLGYNSTIGAATQGTSRNTAVTISNVTGAITLFSSTTTANTINVFTVTNTTVAAADTVILNQRTGNTSAYQISVSNVAAGSFQVQVYNYLAVAVAEAPVLNFAVLKTA